MKKLTSLILAGTLCFVGFGLTGCGGPGENTVVESAGPSTETGDEVLQSQQQMDDYAAEMARAMNPNKPAAPAPAAGGGDAPAE